ncbi:MAG TPA: hypothetical protein VLC98_08060 [Phnomibacter sp.]|nr:hypothetical protein [Phnomibacter sp.]
MTEQEIPKGLETMLHKGKCILVLGPEAHLMDSYKEDELPSHWDIMVDKIDDLKGKSFNKAEGFFFSSGSGNEWYDEKNSIYDSIVEYYSQLKAPAFYDYLASLPFSSIISLSPDDLLPGVMDRLGYPYDFVHYKKAGGGSQYKLYIQTDKNDGKRNFKTARELDRRPDANHPLIFNFLGYYEDSASILFTYESLFEFMYDVFPVSNIPADIRTAVSDADAYLFVGFGYRYWYLKIMFFLFDKILKEQNRNFNSQAIFNYGEKQNPIVDVYQQVFKMQFFKTPTQDFADLLFKRAATVNKLRQRPVAKKHFKVLFLASLPTGKMPIRPDKDWALIKKLFEVPIILGEVEVAEQLCAKVEDILHLLNSYTPNMLIISTHGSVDGLFLETANDAESIELSGDALVDKVQAHCLSPGNQLQVVLLGACHSAKHAEKLAQVVEHTVGMVGPIHDESVRLFAGGFLRNYCIAMDMLSSVAAGKQSIADDPRFNVDRDLVTYYQKELRTTTVGLPEMHAVRATSSMQSEQQGKQKGI